MEYLEQQSDRSVVGATNGKLRRRGCWWSILLAIALVPILAAVLSGRSSRPAFAFLANAEPFQANEILLVNTSTRSIYAQTYIYRIPKPYKEVASEAKKELVAKGFRISVEGDIQIVMGKTSDRTHVVATTEKANTLINVSIFRDATLIDRARLWIKDRISPNETASQRRIKAMTGGP